MSRQTITRARERDADALRRLAEFDPNADLSALAEALGDSRLLYDVLGGDPYATDDTTDDPDDPDESDEPVLILVPMEATTPCTTPIFTAEVDDETP